MTLGRFGPGKLALAGLALTVAVGVLAWSLAPQGETKSDKPSIGLLTSLPIYWGESDDIGGMLADDAQPHWVRARLEQDYNIALLDTLASDGEPTPGTVLASLDHLIVAQPAPLPPADLAALDQWVRDGGRVLLFADPMLTEHSQFGFGDKRRPQDIIMLSPLLARWGLELTFDPDAIEVDAIDWDGVRIPVEQAGAFRLSGSEVADCALVADGLVAQCKVGQGFALLLADAAVLEQSGDMSGRKEAFDSLLQRAFSGD